MELTTKKPFLSTHELAAILGIRRDTLAHWRCEGRGPKFMRVGRTVRYTHEDVERFLGRSMTHTLDWHTKRP